MSIAVIELPSEISEDRLLDELQYRFPMQVGAIMVFPDIHEYPSFPVCPRCNITLDREYMHYCDRCGQCLSWKHYKDAIIVYPPYRKYK